MLEYAASVQTDKNRQVFKPNLVYLLNENNVPLHLKKDLLLFFLRNYSEAATLKEVDFGSLLNQVQQ